MYSLFWIKFNWLVYFLVLVVIKITWPDLSWYSFIALAITLHQFLLLFFSIGAVIPIRYLFGAFMCLQMLLGPTFAYNGLDTYQLYEYKMKVTESAYFAYTIPAVILFIIGLHITAGKLKGEQLQREIIRMEIDKSGPVPYYFIGAGFISSLVAGFFSSELSFVFTLLGSLKFVGAFMLLLGSRQLKFGVLSLVFGSIILSSLGNAMFHDLLTWLIMLGAVLAIKYKPGIKLKALVAFGFILMAVIIQQLKAEYRVASNKSGGGGIEKFESVYEARQGEDNGIFSFQSLAQSNVRINQGFIVTNIMNNVPAKVPFANGDELYTIVESAIMPRVLAPNKLNAGDRNIFTKYSGIPLARGTSMGLSSVGDAYINFGVFWGSVMMFFLGLLFSAVLNAFYKSSKHFPILLLFTPLVFYYPIRPDCELQTTLGHLVKSCFIIYVMFLFWKRDRHLIKERKVATEPNLS